MQFWGMASDDSKAGPGVAARPKQAARVFVAAAFAASFATICFSALHTISVLPEATILITSLSVCALVALVALGWLSPTRSSSGLAAAIYGLLPGIVGWSAAGPVRALAVATLSVGAALLSFVIGPGSLTPVSVACGDARFLGAGGEDLRCSGLWSRTRWTPIGARSEAAPDIQCVAADGRQRWSPARLSGQTYDCGARPRDPKVIDAGIDLAELDPDTVVGRRTTLGVGRIRDSLSAALPARNVRDNLLIATWNIRDFGRGDRRLDESYFYIAEIVSHFDIVAVQEIVGSNAHLERVVDLLGEDWAMVIGAPSPGGNERLAFLFDTRKVLLGNHVSNIVVLGAMQLSRPPYLVSFQVGAFELLLCNVHFTFLNDDDQRRLEIGLLLDYLLGESRRGGPSRDLVLLGDFNTRKVESEEILLIRDGGFEFDPELAALATTIQHSHPRDQIALLPASNRLQVGRIGVHDVFADVFLSADSEDYRAEMGGSFATPEDRRRDFERWRTRQMSDHLVKWAELRIAD